MIVDPNYNNCSNLKYRLEEVGYQVQCFANGEIAWSAIHEKKNYFNLCITEIAMPKISGIELIRLIRKHEMNMLTVVYTFDSKLATKVSGFESGADGYIVRPITTEELLLRIRRMLARNRPLDADRNIVFKLGSLMLDYSQNELVHISRKSKRILTLTESNILRYLCENPNKDLSRGEITLHIWGADSYFLGRSLDVFITKLRKYLMSEAGVKIENVRGVGYKFIMPTPALGMSPAKP